MPKKRSERANAATASPKPPKSSVWTIEVADTALADIKKLGATDKARITKFIFGRLSSHPDPKKLAEPLFGNFAGFGRFRVGDFRIVCEIKELRLIIRVVRVKHRREVYR